jgi:hypothetical protein
MFLLTRVFGRMGHALRDRNALAPLDPSHERTAAAVLTVLVGDTTAFGRHVTYPGLSRAQIVGEQRSVIQELCTAGVWRDVEPATLGAGTELRGAQGGCTFSLI